MKNGRVSENVDDADFCSVISSHPIVLGNSPKNDDNSMSPVALLGQVACIVEGHAFEGGYIVAAGKRLGKCVAMQDLSLDDVHKIVGRCINVYTRLADFIMVTVLIGTVDHRLNQAVTKLTVQSMMKSKCTTNDDILEERFKGGTSK